VATTQDGKEYPTVGAGKGKVALDNYTMQATVVQVSKRGVVSLSSDPRVSEGQVGHLHIVPTAHPEPAADLDVPVRYDTPFVAKYAGAAGQDGRNGLDGLGGSSGTDGSPADFDPTTGALGNPGPGGDGTNGQPGEDGGNGEDAAPGGKVNAWIRLEPGPKPRGARMLAILAVRPALRASPTAPRAISRSTRTHVPTA
jgi:hypothetical protein